MYLSKWVSQKYACFYERECSRIYERNLSDYGFDSIPLDVSIVNLITTFKFHGTSSPSIARTDYSL